MIVCLLSVSDWQAVLDRSTAIPLQWQPSQPSLDENVLCLADLVDNSVIVNESQPDLMPGFTVLPGEPIRKRAPHPNDSYPLFVLPSKKAASGTRPRVRAGPKLTLKMGSTIVMEGDVVKPILPPIKIPTAKVKKGPKLLPIRIPAAGLRLKVEVDERKPSWESLFDGSIELVEDFTSPLPTPGLTTADSSNCTTPVDTPLVTPISARGLGLYDGSVDVEEPGAFGSLSLSHSCLDLTLGAGKRSREDEERFAPSKRVRRMEPFCPTIDEEECED